MKNMNVHDLHFDEYFLTFLGHDNSSIGNVQEAYHMEPKNPLVVEVMHDDASIHHWNAFQDFAKIEASMEATLSYFPQMRFCQGE